MDIEKKNKAKNKIKEYIISKGGETGISWYREEGKYSKKVKENIRDFKNFMGKFYSEYYMRSAIFELEKEGEIKKTGLKGGGIGYKLQTEEEKREKREAEERELEIFYQMKKDRICKRCNKKTLKIRNLAREYTEAIFFNDEFCNYLYCPFCIQDYYSTIPVEKILS